MQRGKYYSKGHIFHIATNLNNFACDAANLAQ